MYSLTPTLTWKLCVVEQAHYAKVFHVFALRINVLPQEASTGLSLLHLQMGYDGSLDLHTPEHSCQWKWA